MVTKKKGVFAGLLAAIGLSLSSSNSLAQINPIEESSPQGQTAEIVKNYRIERNYYSNGKLKEIIVRDKSSNKLLWTIYHDKNGNRTKEVYENKEEVVITRDGDDKIIQIKLVEDSGVIIIYRYTQISKKDESESTNGFYSISTRELKSNRIAEMSITEVNSSGRIEKGTLSLFSPTGRTIAAIPIFEGKLVFTEDAQRKAIEAFISGASRELYGLPKIDPAKFFSRTFYVDTILFF